MPVQFPIQPVSEALTTQQTRVNASRIFLAACALEGALLVPAAFLWGQSGLSRTQFALLILAGLLELIFASLAALVFLQPGRLRPALERLQAWLTPAGRLLRLATGLVFLALLIAALLILLTSPAASRYDTYSAWFSTQESLARFESLRSLAARILPALVWGLLLLVQAAGWLVAGFPGLARPPGLSWTAQVGKTMLLMAMASLFVFQVMVLGLQMRTFTNIPGWYWSIAARPFQARELAFLASGGLALGATWFTLRCPRRAGWCLALLVAAGYLLQVSFGILDGRGFEYIRLKYAGTFHKSYAVRVTAKPLSLVQNVRDYESLYRGTLFAGTKPPGVLTFYILAGRLANALDPQPTAAGRFLALTRFEAYSFPLAAFLVLLALYALARSLIDPPLTLLPAALYLFVPNVMLFPLFLDQVFYPLLFTIGILLAAMAVRRGSFWSGALAGAFLYLAVFFSFSMLPLLPLAGLVIALDYLIKRREQPLIRPVRIFGGLALGLAAMYLLFLVTLHYNVIDRYQGAMATVQYTDYVLRAGSIRDTATSGLWLRLREIAGAMWLNNLDFAAAVGFPLFLLFLLRGVKSLVALARRSATGRDVLLGACFLTYLAMNLYGQNRGEAARLWLFWVPVVSIFAAVEIADLFENRPRAVLLIALAQLVTLFLTFQFQDFWM